jgi:hypothetical protein
MLRIFTKKRILLAVFSVALVFLASVNCYSRTVEDILLDSSVSEEDSKKIKDIYYNIKSFDIEENEVLLIIDNALKNGIDAKRILRLLVLVSKTAVEDIPIKALNNKILEGLAKEAPADVIIKEAQSKVLFLKNAKAILNYLLLRGYETKQPETVINMLSIYLNQGWEPTSLKREIESGGLTKKEFHELSVFLKRK